MNTQPDFFFAGGTLRPQTPSYVVRPADKELLQCVLNGEFCYILTSRQMGKSSLMVQTSRKLKDNGIIPILIDLTSIGTASMDEWYLGLLTRIKNTLRLNIDIQEWWSLHQNLGTSQRWMEFLLQAVLPTTEENIAIFIDEIDSMLNLPFRDDFFASIRAIYNDRAYNEAYSRLTFILLGVATPTDLIQDRELTPFNIGHRIVLQEFDYNDAMPLQKGLEAYHSDQGERILKRIFYWTNGHPYLTQKLCLEIIRLPTPLDWFAASTVDKVVHQTLFSERAQRDGNLLFVQDRIQSVRPSERSKILNLYERVYDGQLIPDNERSSVQNQLELFGLLGVKNGHLQIRNEIYRYTFNKSWIKASMPKKGQRSVAILSSLIALILVALVVYLIVNRPNPPDIQAQIYEDLFNAAQTDSARIEALANLFDLGSGFDVKARELYFSKLTIDQQRSLFQYADSENMGSRLIVVVKGIYVALDTQPDRSDRGIMDAMIKALIDSGQPEANKLIEEIRAWQKGRDLAENGHYQQALDAYTIALDLYDKHPVIHYERALAYIKLGQYANALTDLEQLIQIANSSPPTPTPRATSLVTPGQKTPLPVRSTTQSVLTQQAINPTTSHLESPKGHSTTIVLDGTAEITNTVSLTPTPNRMQVVSLRFIGPDQIKETVRVTIRDVLALQQELQNNLPKYQGLALLFPDTARANPTIAAILALTPSMTVSNHAGDPVRIIIDSINLDSIVVSVGLDKNRVPIMPLHEPGWYNLSARPAEGENVVIWGERLRFTDNPRIPAPFGRLQDLQPGAEVVIHTVDNKSYTYIVKTSFLVTPDQVEYILPQGKEQLTLLTGGGEGKLVDNHVEFSHRLVVIAEPAARVVGQ